MAMRGARVNDQEEANRQASRRYFPSQFAHLLDSETAYERPPKPPWNSQHYVVFSTVNPKLTANMRDYFDRPRGEEAYGLRWDPPLKVTWTLKEELTKQSKPKRLGGHGGTPWPPRPPRTKGSSRAGSPWSTHGGSEPPGQSIVGAPDGAGGGGGLQRSASAPVGQAGGAGGFGSRSSSREKPPWRTNHHIMFCKDNHHYHRNFRMYFDREKPLLW